MTEQKATPTAPLLAEHFTGFNASQAGEFRTKMQMAQGDTGAAQIVLQGSHDHRAAMSRMGFYLCFAHPSGAHNVAVAWGRWSALLQLEYKGKA